MTESRLMALLDEARDDAELWWESATCLRELYEREREAHSRTTRRLHRALEKITSLEAAMALMPSSWREVVGG